MPGVLLAFAMAQWRATSALRIEDAYKWLYHATLGGEHAVTDDDGPRRWMTREWRTLGRPLPGEPDVVPLDPKGRLIRVNLRPYKARGDDPERLLAVFVASAKRFHADKSAFVGPWKELGQALRKKRIGQLTYTDWMRLDRETRGDGYPAIDHSAAYESAYHPAYRVVLRELWVRRKQIHVAKDKVSKIATSSSI